MYKRNSKIIINVIIYVILILGAIIMAFPFYYMFITSLKESAYIFSFPPQLIPKPMTFQNYVTVWKEADFARYFVNSVTITLPAILLNVLLSTLTAYGFARYNFPFKETFFSLLIATLAVPGLLLIIPQFDIISKIKWLMDNKVTLIFTGGIGGIAFNAFFLRGFFEAMPVEYEESAEIDGANAWQRFIHIVFPQALPAVGALTIMSFMGIWDDYFWPSLILSSKNNWTLPIGIMGLKGQFSVQWNILFAGTMISLLPVLVIYVIFQKYFIQSVSEGGLKL